MIEKMRKMQDRCKALLPELECLSMLFDANYFWDWETTGWIFAIKYKNTKSLFDATVDARFWLKDNVTKFTESLQSNNYKKLQDRQK